MENLLRIMYFSPKNGLARNPCVCTQETCYRHTGEPGSGSTGTIPNKGRVHRALHNNWGSSHESVDMWTSCSNTGSSIQTAHRTVQPANMPGETNTHLSISRTTIGSERARRLRIVLGSWANSSHRCRWRQQETLWLQADSPFFLEANPLFRDRNTLQSLTATLYSLARSSPARHVNCDQARER